MPTVEGWQPDLSSRAPRVFVAHGRGDPVIGVDFAHTARSLLEEVGLDVVYHESDVGHTIDPAHLPAARSWLAETLGP